MKNKVFVILVLFSLVFFDCHRDYKYELILYQSFYFAKGQQFELRIDDGLYSKSKSFKRTYQSGEYRKLKTYRTDSDSIKIYFKLDDKDTVFTIPSDYTKRLVVGSSAYGDMLVGTDKESNFWETQ